MQFRLAEYGLVFSTRDRGSKLRADLLESIAQTTAGTTVIDFADVRSASYSFIDEFIGELVGSIGTDALELVNMSSTIAETVERSLRRRGLGPERVLAGLLVHA